MLKSAEKLWETYPRAKLHCEVTASGNNSYRIVMSLFTEDNSLIGTIEQSGTGDLSTLKETTFMHLVEHIFKTVA